MCDCAKLFHHCVHECFRDSVRCTWQHKRRSSSMRPHGILTWLHKTCTQRGQAVSEASRGYTSQCRLFAQMATWTQRKHKRAKHWESKLDNAATWGDCTCEPRLGRPRTPGRRESGQRAPHPRPTHFCYIPPVSRCTESLIGHSDVFNSNHVSHNWKRLLNEYHRTPHYIFMQCAKKGYLHFTALHQLNEVRKEDVPVPLAETLGVVRHL